MTNFLNVQDDRIMHRIMTDQSTLTGTYKPTHGLFRLYIYDNYYHICLLKKTLKILIYRKNLLALRVALTICYSIYM